MNTKQKTALILASTVLASPALHALELEKDIKVYKSDLVNLIYPPEQDDFVFNPNGIQSKGDFSGSTIQLTINGTLQKSKITSIKGAWSLSPDKLAEDDVNLIEMPITSDVAPFIFDLSLPPTEDIYWYHTQITFISGDILHYSSPVFNISDKKLSDKITVNHNGLPISKIQLKPGDSFPVDVVVMPDDISDKTFTVKSTDPSTIDFVSNSIVAHRKGNATLTFTSKLNNNITTSVAIEIDDNILTSLNVTPDPLEVNLNKTLQVKVTETYTDTTNMQTEDLSYYPTTDGIIDITPTGLIAGRQVGTTNLTIVSNKNNLVSTVMPVSVHNRIVLPIIPGVPVPVIPNRPVPNLPIKDEQGNTVIDENDNVLNKDGSVIIDNSGNIVSPDGYVIVDSNNNIKSPGGEIIVDNEGNIYDQDGNIVVDKNGNLTDKGELKPDGSVLDKGGNIVIDTEGNIVYPNTNLPVVDKDGNIHLPDGDIVLDSNQNVLDKDGNVIVDNNGNFPSLSPAITNIQIDTDNLILTIGEKQKLTVTVNPVDANLNSLSWSSGNPDIVRVSQSGEIEALDKGSTIVTVKTKEGLTSACSVTVKDILPQGPITNVNIVQSTVLLEVNETRKVDYTITPAGLTDVVWQSQDGNVAIVDQFGNITAKGEGETTVTLTTTDGSQLSDKVNILVSKKDDNMPEITIPAKSISFESNLLEINVGDKVTLPQIIFNPINATVDASSMTYGVNNDSVLKLENNEITGMQEGITKITATLGDIQTELIVNVKQKVEDFTITISDITLEQGQSEQIQYEVLPLTSTNKKILWKSSDENIATVSPTGTVKAIKEGAVKLTGTTIDGNITKSINVTVTPIDIQSTGIDLLQSKIIMPINSRAKLNYKFTPIDATNRNITWTSDDEGIATISEATVSSHSIGTTTITVQTDNGQTDTVLIEVVPEEEWNKDGTNVSYIQHIDDSITMFKGTRKAIGYTLSNPDAFNSGINWNSQNEDIAEVDNTGLVTAIEQGNTKVRVDLEDASIMGYITTGPSIVADTSGIITSLINVSVLSLVDGITIPHAVIPIEIDETKAIDFIINPTDATNKDVTFTTTDSDVVSIDSNGNITGLKPGTATVTVTTADSNYSDTVTIVVTKNVTKSPEVAVEKVMITTQNITLNVGEDKQISYEVRPLNATNKTLNYIVEDGQILSISAEGKITAKAKGITKITLVAESGATATMTVNVIEGDNPTPPEPGENDIKLTVNTDKVNYEVGEEILLNISVTPTESNTEQFIKSLITTVADSTIVEMINNKLYAKSEGTTQITVKTPNDKTKATISVTVKSKDNGGNHKVNVQKVTTNKSEIEMNVGDRETLNVSVLPSNATNKQLTYEVFNDNIVTVTGTGRLVAHKPGMTYVKVTSVDNPDAYVLIDVTVEEDRKSDNNNVNQDKTDESKYEKEVNIAVKKIQEQMPFTLPAGKFDIATHFGINKSLTNPIEIDILTTVNNINVKVGDRKVNTLTEGIELNGTDKIYKDVKPNHWAYTNVKLATELGLLKGKEADKYYLSDKLTIAESVVALNRVLMLNDRYIMTSDRIMIEKLLKDNGIDSDQWAYYSYASVVSQLNPILLEQFVKQTSNLTSSITRQQLADTLYSLTYDIPTDKTMPTYIDIPILNQSVIRVSQLGLMKGDNRNRFKPNETLTRAELAQVVIRLNNLLTDK